MKKGIFTVAVVLFGTVVMGQKDPKATEILNQLSEQTKSHSSIKATFTYAIKSDDINEEQSGTLLLSGDKYTYNLFGITKVSDGKSIATLNPMDEEIIITEVNYDDPDEISPNDMFNIYERGFKYRFIKEITEGSRTLNVVELYPDAENESPYRRITLYIDKEKNEMYRIEFFHKTSSKIFSITLNRSEYDLTLPNNKFKVDCSIVPEYDCDDQRGAK